MTAMPKESQCTARAVCPVHLGQALRPPPEPLPWDGTVQSGLGLWQGREGVPGSTALMLAAGWRSLPARPTRPWGLRVSESRG